MLHPSYLLCTAPTRSSAFPIRLDRLRVRSRAAALSPLSVGGSASKEALTHCVDVVFTLPGATAAQRHSLGRALTADLALIPGRAPFSVAVTAGGQRINGRRDPRLQHPASAALRTARAGRTIRRTVRSPLSSNKAGLPFFSSSEIFKGRDRVLTLLSRSNPGSTRVARTGIPQRPRIVFSTLPLLSDIAFASSGNSAHSSALSRQLVRPLGAEDSSFFTPNTISPNPDNVAAELVSTRASIPVRVLPSFLSSPTVVQTVGNSFSRAREAPVGGIIRLLDHFVAVSSPKVA
jgi:hypothetical protein